MVTMKTVHLVLMSMVVLHHGKVFGVEPSFDVPVINVTVHEGDIAVLPCSVEHLGEHKVVWTDQWSTLLTLDDRRIIDDTRISIERPHTRDWNLHIRRTEYKDRGQYTCQINTNPVKTKTVMLIVQVPSKIIDELSSRDQIVREGETVTLVCNVTGVPTPEVKWFKLPSHDGLSTEKERLDLEPGLYTAIGSCAYTLQQTGIGTAGEVLIIHNVSRYCDGIYACMAFNEVEPAVTRSIKVFVEFAPEVSLPSMRLGQYLGKDTILDCEISAYPHGVTTWKRNGRELNFHNKEKYSVELYSGTEESTKKTLSLRVQNIQPADFGRYTCYAQNSIGDDDETMVLYDYSEHIQKATTTARSLIIQPTITKRPYFPPIRTHPDVVISGSEPDFDDDYNPNRPGLNLPGKGRLSSTGDASRNYVTISSLLYVVSLTVSYLLS